MLVELSWHSLIIAPIWPPLSVYQYAALSAITPLTNTLQRAYPYENDPGATAESGLTACPRFYYAGNTDLRFDTD